MRSIDRLLDPAEVARKRAMYDRLLGRDGAAPEASPTSLASYRQSVTQDEDPPVPERCPRKLGWRWRNLDTGETFAARCEANTCVYCLPRNVSARADAISYATPERFIRYSLVGDDWQTIRKRYKVLSDRIRSRGYTSESCYFVEPYESGAGNHIHAFQHGDYIPQHELVELATSVGFAPNTDIRRWQTYGSRSTRYTMKNATGYGMKTLRAATEAAETYLALNGQRLHHHTRGFFRHPDGRHIGNVKEAVKAARRASRTSVGEWVIEREPDSPDAH